MTFFLGSGMPLDLLAGESDGLAVNFTEPCPAVQVRTASASYWKTPDQFFTNSGTSPKLVKISEATLGWSPHNMFLNSGAPATQNVTLVTGFQYTYGITGNGSLAGSSGASGTATAGSPVTFVATGTTGTFTLTGTAYTMQINRGPSLKTYIPTVGSIVIGVPISYQEGLLIEPAATNLHIESQTYNTASWSKTASSVTTDATTAPDGTTTADLFIPDVNNVAHYMSNTPAITGSVAVYTWSVYAKAAGYNFAEVCCLAKSGGQSRYGVVVDLTTGAVTQTGSNSSPTSTASIIENVGNGWWRISVQQAADATATSCYSLLSGCPTGTPSVDAGLRPTFSGDGTSGVYFWGSQMELGAVTTSYIQTVTASVTRATDAVNVLTSAYGHSATVGTYIMWAADRELNSANALRWFTVSDGTGGEQFNVEHNTADTPDSLGFRISDGGVAQVDPTVTKGGSASVTGNKIAVAYQVNNSGLVFNAGTEVTDTVCTMPTVTRIDLGYQGSSANRELNGFIQRLIYLPRRMTQTEMQARTT